MVLKRIQLKNQKNDTLENIGITNNFDRFAKVEVFLYL